MPELKARQKLNWLFILAASIWLSGCSERSVTEKPFEQSLQFSVFSPVPLDAAELQNVSSFDVYVDRQTIHAVFTATGNDAGQPLIAYLHSEDAGRHWSAPLEIGKQFNLPVESKAGNDIQIAATANNLLIIWQTTGEIPGMGPLVTVYSTDGGKSWRKGANPMVSDTDQSHPDLAADEQGNFHLVWLDDRDENGYQGVRYARSRDAGQHWEAQQTLDDSSCSCCWNRLSLSGPGTVSVLYRDMEPRDMALAQSVDAGQSWQRVSTVGDFNWQFNGCPHNGGGLTQTGDDVHSVVWTGAENRTGLYHMHSMDAGLTWGAPQSVGTGTGAFHSDIAALDDNRLAVIWEAMGPEGSAVLFANSSDNGGTWSTAHTLSTPGLSALFPRLVASGSGWLAMWMEQKSKTSKQWLAAVIQ